MKYVFALLLLFFAVTTVADDLQLEKYISNFDYVDRVEMKMSSKRLINLLKEGKAQLVDIRFPEEYAAWKVGPSINIPLNELPARLNELDRTKIIVTACPHKDRAIITMAYLRSKKIPARYLRDGLIGLAENLRGDNTQAFIEAIK